MVSVRVRVRVQADAEEIELGFRWLDSTGVSAGKVRSGR